MTGPNESFIHAWLVIYLLLKMGSLLANLLANI